MSRAKREGLSFEDLVKELEGMLNENSELYFEIYKYNHNIQNDMKFIMSSIRNRIEEPEKTLAELGIEVSEELEDRMYHLNVNLLYMIIQGDIKNIIEFAELYVILLNNFGMITNNDTIQTQCICIERLLYFNSNFELMILLSNDLIAKYQTLHQYEPRTTTLSRNYLESLEKRLSGKKEEK